jgi:hypothetical protein
MTKITQNFYQTKTKRTSNVLFGLFVLLLMNTQVSWGQFTGSFFTDGGMEGQIIGNVTNVTGTGSLDTAKWRTITATSTTGITTSAVVSNTGNARSGAKYLNFVSDNTNTGVKIVHPRNNNDASRPKLVSNTAYVVQFYYKPSVDGTIYPYIGMLCPTGATTPFYNGSAITTTITPTGWIKAVSLVPATVFTTAPSSNGTAGIFIPSGTATNAFYDDYVVYAGTAVDNTVPDAPVSLVVNSSASQNVVTWTAPATGVDGGGYLLVRYLGNPSADSDPNVNGVYSFSKLLATVPATAADMLASVIGKGAGAVDGTVVYSGTALTYTDSALPVSAESYYYKLYTVDKAFNYSSELKGTGGSSSPVLVADATANNVDNAIDISFTDDVVWRGLVSAVKINGTDLLPADYALTAGNLQLKPSNGNVLLTTPGSKTVTVISAGYGASAVLQTINIGALDLTKSTVVLISGPLAPGATKTMTCTAKDQFNNLISGYQFKIDATITNVNVVTTESYIVDGIALTATTNDISLATVTNASGVASFTISIPAIVDEGDGISVQVQLNNGTTNIGSAASYSQPITFTTWTTSWSNGVPTATKDAIIAGNYSTANASPEGEFTAKKLTINSGVLTIASGTKVTVQNEVVNNAAAANLVVENNANLIQVNDIANTGVITVNRNSNSLNRLDYTMWSSPVNGAQTLASFSPLTSTNRFYEYNPATDLYSAVANTGTFSTAKGYLIRMPNENPSDLGTTTPYYLGAETIAHNGVFTGTPNNGSGVSLTGLTVGKYYAVGNPYPSTLIATALLAGNPLVSGTLYFWRKTNNPGSSSYATWTILGSTANVGGGSAIVPNGTIQVGQGFIINTGTATALNFANAMRETAPTSTQFFKTKKVNEIDRIWLNLTTVSGVFSQALVGYMDGATLGVDNGIDGKYINDSPVALTSNIDNEEYTIQGRPAFDASDVVPLNFKTASAGDYTIAIDHSDGVFAAGQEVYLVDVTTGTETDLTAASYTFTAGAGASNARFSLKYQKSLGTNASVITDNNVVVCKTKGTLSVNAGNVVIANVKVYDVQGKLVTELKNVKSTSATVADLKATKQVLVVKVTLEGGKVVTKKVVN